MTALGEHNDQFINADDADNSMEQRDTSEIVGDFSMLYD